MNPILMRAVVDFVLFLNLSGEDVIDPHVSVGLLEQLSATLKGLTVEDRKVFAQYVKELMASEQTGVNHTGYVETLSALIEDLGIPQ